MAEEQEQGPAVEPEIRSHDIIAGAAVEIAEEALPEDHRREFVSRDDETLFDRLLLLCSSPTTLFTQLNPAKGWFWTFIAVIVASMLHGVVVMNLTDLDGWYALQEQNAYQAMPDWQRRAFDKQDEGDKRTQQRLRFFMVKAKLFVWPGLKSTMALGFFAFIVFLSSALGRGKRSFPLCLVVVAHALLIDALRFFCMAVVAAGTGLTMVTTDLSRIATVKSAPVVHALLAWVDPFTWAFYLFLAIGIVKTMKVKRPVLALSLLAFIILFSFSASVGLAFVTSKAAQMFTKG